MLFSFVGDAGELASSMRCHHYGRPLVTKLANLVHLPVATLAGFDW